MNSGIVIARALARSNPKKFESFLDCFVTAFLAMTCNILGYEYKGKDGIMGIEFATSIDDYNFPDIPEKMLKALKENMLNTMLFEKVPAFAVVKSKDIIDNQTYWRLV